MFTRVSCALALVLLLGCENPPASPVDVHIPPSANHGCEIVCKDGICTITCPFKYGCKSEGECYCLKDGTYKGYCKDGVCTYRIPIAE